MSSWAKLLGNVPAATLRSEVREAQQIVEQRSAELRQRYEDCDGRAAELRLRIIGQLADIGIVADMPAEKPPMADIKLEGMDDD